MVAGTAERRKEKNVPSERRGGDNRVSNPERTGLEGVGIEERRKKEGGPSMGSERGGERTFEDSLFRKGGGA